MVAIATLALAAQLLPNLVQLPPDKLEVNLTPAGYEVRFQTTSVNAGRGPLWLESARRSASEPFQTVQVIRLANGRTHRQAVPVRVEYEGEPTHGHFHTAGYERMELRDAAGRVVLRGHKAGFCVADEERASVPTEVAPARKRFPGTCGTNRPNALRLTQGLSVGWAEPYGPSTLGQQLELTGLPAGTYFLVNRVNPGRALRESSYDDNVAATRFELAWPTGDAGPPTVIATALCPGTVRC